jgi:hypothetical protein
VSEGIGHSRHLRQLPARFPFFVVALWSRLRRALRPTSCSPDRFEAFKRRDLYDIRLAALFLDAVFLSVRRDGPKEGVLVAWGFTQEGKRVLLSVMLGMRESHEDWLSLGRDLIARGLAVPMLIVAANPRSSRRTHSLRPCVSASYVAPSERFRPSPSRGIPVHRDRGRSPRKS